MYFSFRQYKYLNIVHLTTDGKSTTEVCSQKPSSKCFEAGILVKGGIVVQFIQVLAFPAEFQKPHKPTNLVWKKVLIG